jgi:DNA integrity scanning protein DisA with diadenylate cyclase activity
MDVELGDAFLDAAVKVGKLGNCTRVLIICAGPVDPEKIKPIKKKLVYAVPYLHVVERLQAEGYDAVPLPGLTTARMDRLKAALVGAMSAGHLEPGDNVLCAMSREESGGPIDTLIHLTAGDIDEERTSLAVTSVASDIPPQLLEVVVDLALRIGREGYEGRALGTLIVVGDSTRVMEKSHPLTLNPFQGYSEVERNLFDTHVRDAMRTFAMLDGAFVVRDDGVVLAAGRHIRVGEGVPNLPLGYGARHTAAASISAESDAIGIVVSQSSGAVRVFQNGAIVLEIQPGQRRAEDAAEVVEKPKTTEIVRPKQKKKRKKPAKAKD